MRHYTLAELASPQGAREFIDECEKLENSVVQDIVDNIKRAVQQGTDWSDGELCDIVQKEIEEILRDRAELIEALQAILDSENGSTLLDGGSILGTGLADQARAALARVQGKEAE